MVGKKEKKSNTHSNEEKIISAELRLMAEKTQLLLMRYNSVEFGCAR